MFSLFSSRLGALSRLTVHSFSALGVPSGAAIAALATFSGR